MYMHVDNLFNVCDLEANLSKTRHVIMGNRCLKITIIKKNAQKYGQGKIYMPNPLKMGAYIFIFHYLPMIIQWLC